VSFIKPTEQSPVTIEVKVYNYDTQTWNSGFGIPAGYILELHGIDRQRDKILLFSQNSDYPFYINAEFATQSVDIPFYNNTQLSSTSMFPCTNPSRSPRERAGDHRLRDPDEHGLQLSSHNLEIQRTAGILVQGGTLETYSHFSETHPTSPPRIGVNFLPLELNELSPRKSWRGLEVMAFYGGMARIRDASIRHAMTASTLLHYRLSLAASSTRATSVRYREMAACSWSETQSVTAEWALRPLMTRASQAPAPRPYRFNLRSSGPRPWRAALPSKSHWCQRRYNILIRHSEIRTTVAME
jgi:hypothetical protein